MRSRQAIRTDLAQSVLLLRGGRASCRRSLARAMQLAPSTAGHYVEQLIERRLVSEEQEATGGRGRPRKLLRVEGSAGWFAGIEFHADRIQAVALDFAGRKLNAEQARFPAAVTTRQILDKIVRMVRGLGQNHPRTLLGLGVGAPGVVDPRTGIAGAYAFVRDWREVPVVARLKRRLGVEVTLENNLRAIAAAERWFGIGRQHDDFVVLGPRSGFGLAIVLGGQLWAGSELAAGEVGYWPNDAGGPGQLHDSLTAPAVWRRLTHAPNTRRPPADLKTALSRLADPGSSVFQAVVGDFARFLTRVHLLLNTAAYVLHGPLAGLGPAFCDAVVREVVRLTPQLGKRPPRFEPTQLGDDAGAVGAGCQAMESWQPQPN